MNNPRKPSCNPSMGLRAPKAVHMADGGFLRRVVNTLMPGTKNVNEPANAKRINDAIEQQTAAPAPAPAPVTEAPVKEFRFARGGQVHGPGTSTSDSIPARLSDGEFVMPADSVEAIGAHNLEAMRQATHTPVRSRGMRGGAGHFVNGTDDPVGDYKKAMGLPSRQPAVTPAGASGDWGDTNTVLQTAGTAVPAAAGAGPARSGFATARDIYNAGDGLRQVATPAVNAKALGTAMPTVEQVAGRAPGLLTTETVPVNQASWGKNAADFAKSAVAGDVEAANVAKGALAGKAASEGLMTKAAPGIFTKVTSSTLSCATRSSKSCIPSSGISTKTSCIPRRTNDIRVCASVRTGTGVPTP